MRSRPRVAWLSALPPSPTGIADYAAALLPHLAERADVVVYTESGQERVDAIEVRPAYELDLAGHDAVVAHLANNLQHVFAYRVARNHPCVAVFHDLVLHPVLASFADGDERIGMYEEPLAAELGAPGRRLAARRRLRIAGGHESYLFPLSGHVARSSRVAIVHSEDSRRRLAPAAGETPVQMVPHLALAPPPSVAGTDRPRARSALGLPGNAFVVGQLGFLTPPKQPEAVLDAFARLRARVPHALLLLVGRDETDGAMAALVRERGLQDAVRTTGFVSLEDLHRALAAVDVVVSLRFPTAGESSGTVIRALTAGRPMVVSDHGSFAELPDAAARKVPIDGRQTDVLTEHLLTLAADAAGREEMGKAAVTYARTALDPGRCAEGYLQAIADA
jgi:glycosyltransferase involved in cell wall biosynthesis